MHLSKLLGISSKEWPVQSQKGQSEAYVPYPATLKNPQILEWEEGQGTGVETGAEAAGRRRGGNGAD